MVTFEPDLNNKDIGNNLTSRTEKNEGQCGWCLDNGEEEAVHGKVREMQGQDYVRLTGYHKELEFYIKCNGKPLVCFRLD